VDRLKTIRLKENLLQPALKNQTDIRLQSSAFYLKTYNPAGAKLPVTSPRDALPCPIALRLPLFMPTTHYN